MAQWFAAKEAHPDALVFFRMGDFYELFFADAEAAAAALDIALTQRGEHNGRPMPMCGVPQHAAEAYLARLIRRGFRVAVAEQMEDPKSRTGKAPIRRDVVRLVTPGTITEEALLEAGRANLLLGAGAGPPTASARPGSTCPPGCSRRRRWRQADLPGLLGRLEPAEILAPPTLPLGEWADKRAPDVVPSPPLVARRRLAETFGVASLDAFGSFTDAEAIAALMAVDYVRATQAGTLPRLARPAPQGQAGLLAMDAATRASLEIHRARDGGALHTLLGTVQRTLTPAGARLLAGWLAAPLTDTAAIAARQDAWSWHGRRARCRGCGCAPRCGRRPTSRARWDGCRWGAGAAGPCGGARRAAAARRESAWPSRRRRVWAKGERRCTYPPRPRSRKRGAPGSCDGAARCGSIRRWSRLLAAALADPAPHRLDDGNAIRAGFDPELDAERALRDDSRRVLATLQLDYAQRYGVASLKIRHHAQLGYVIEAPAAAVEKLRDHSGTDRCARAWPTAPASPRRNSPTSTAASPRPANAPPRASAPCSPHLVQTALAQADALAACADALALLDAAQSAAKLAEAGTWCRPQVTDDDAFLVRAGRHPVVEAALAGRAAFVPNDCDLSPDQRVLLLTGPNMAGKSTFLRQNALIVVLAQAGLPVPAEGATIGVVDRLFSRVGAADDLARGRSTFMVEMTETAAILHQAGPRSLVVVDEIGRGTATLDGLAIAWAVLEALHSAIRCRTIFATHFHELAELADRLPRLKPHTMRVKEWKGTVVFLHEVAAGAAGRSWGVHVAELAGVPAPVVRRAAVAAGIAGKARRPAGRGRRAAHRAAAVRRRTARRCRTEPQQDRSAGRGARRTGTGQHDAARGAGRIVSPEIAAGSSRHAAAN